MDGISYCQSASKRGSNSLWCNKEGWSRGGISFARSKSSLARPYIWRLTNFNFVICPSVCPLGQGSTMAAFTAFQSSLKPLAKERSGVCRASSIHVASSAPFCCLIIRWKRSARFRTTTSAGTPASIVATSVASYCLAATVIAPKFGPDQHGSCADHCTGKIISRCQLAPCRCSAPTGATY